MGLRERECNFNLREFEMTARIENRNLQDMTVELPYALVAESGVERVNYRLDNALMQACGEHIRTPQACIMEHRIVCQDDMAMYSKAERFNAIWFCAVIQGDVICDMNNSKRIERWKAGNANLLSYEDVDTVARYRGGTAYHGRELMLPMDYILNLAAECSELFDGPAGMAVFDERYRAYRHNRPMCPAIYRALDDIMYSHLCGNVAALYIDAKVREILSLFLCGAAGLECASCLCDTRKDHDKIRHAREIIEREFLSPPSLHKLALMAGTNECTLKKGFKELFGTTVFGYLFDYRMDLAVRYLLDSDKRVQDIAEVVGYGHLSHFSTAFKRKFGLSPSEYRNVRMNKLI